MTDQDAIDIYNRMVKEFGKMPSPIHEPMSFKYYVKLYRYLTEYPEQKVG